MERLFILWHIYFIFMICIFWNTVQFPWTLYQIPSCFIICGAWWWFVKCNLLKHAQYQVMKHERGFRMTQIVECSTRKQFGTSFWGLFLHLLTTLLYFTRACSIFYILQHIMCGYPYQHVSFENTWCISCFHIVCWKPIILMGLTKDVPRLQEYVIICAL